MKVFLAINETGIIFGRGKSLSSAKRNTKKYLRDVESPDNENGFMYIEAIVREKRVCDIHADTDYEEIE